MAKYKIKKEGNKKIIVKSDFEHEFSVDSVKSSWEQLQKQRKELESQRKLEQAKIDNIVKHNPVVYNLDEKERRAVYLYEKSAEIIDACDNKLKEIEEIEKEYKDTITEIKKQTGLKIELK